VLALRSFSEEVVALVRNSWNRFLQEIQGLFDLFEEYYAIQNVSNKVVPNNTRE